jgi:hypothetical protein
MPHYTGLSGRGRDVLAAILDVADAPLDSVEAVEIRNRTAEIRDQEPTDYTYEVLADLEANGWVNSHEDEDDSRVIRYSLSTTAWEAMSDRIDLLSQDQASSPQTTRAKAPVATPPH